MPPGHLARLERGADDKASRLLTTLCLPSEWFRVASLLKRDSLWGHRTASYKRSEIKLCQECGTLHMMLTAQKYCTVACRMRAYRRRKRNYDQV